MSFRSVSSMTGTDTVRYSLLSALLLLNGCAAAVRIDALRETRFTVEDRHSVYLMDGVGEQLTRVLERKQTKDGPRTVDKLYDDYFEPSLSPDGTHVACIRFRNNSAGGNIDELMPLQSVEVLIVRISDRTERLLMSVPASEPGRVYRVLGPVWSADGGRVFFVADQRVWSYSLSEWQLEPIVDLPNGYSGGFTQDFLRGKYLRVSKEGTRLFGLLSMYFGREYDVIVEIDLRVRKLKTLWYGNLSSRSVFEIDRLPPEQLDEDAVETLFGSRQFPVFAPRFSRDRRFYFFVRGESGWFGRVWVGAYDRAERKPFEVRTMWRTLLWK